MKGWILKGRPMKEGSAMFSKSSTFLFVCLLWSVQSYGVHGEEDLFVELTDETFEDAVATPDMIVVKFYAPWLVAVMMYGLSVSKCKF